MASSKCVPVLDVIQYVPEVGDEETAGGNTLAAGVFKGEVEVVKVMDRLFPPPASAM